ncbi:MAG: HEAT repeat domain-containing protein [Bdellovibrionaceae bacterium]|nr:HEAT repeat domain-containing protein [Pseudobdellovibrionaceae bacterium]
MQKRFEAKMKTQGLSHKIIASTERELKIAEDTNYEPYRRGLALQRVSSEAPEAAEGLAFEWLDSPSKELKLAGIKALSRIKNPNVIESVYSFLNDENQDIRISAYSTLYDQKYTDLYNILKSKNLSDMQFDEKIVIYEILLKLEKNSDNKNEIIGILFKNYKKSGVNEKYKILTLLNNFDPGNIKLKEILVNILKTPKDENLQPLAITLLSKSENEWLKKNLTKFLFHKSEHIRLVTLNILTNICPKNSEVLLKKFLAEENNIQLLHLAVKIKEKLSQKLNCIS